MSNISKVVILVALFYFLSTVISIRKKVLLFQNKGGGHGTIGYYLSKQLATSHDVLIVQDKCNYKKSPFSSYKTDLQESLGVQVLDVDTSSPLDQSVLDTIVKFQPSAIVDNWSKNSVNASVIIDVAKKSSSEQIVFISSAGMYKSSLVTPLLETDAVKSSDVRAVEVSVQESGVPFTFLRPQYIYGPKSNKRYLDYFISRAHRKIPIPLPLSAEQLVCLTHIEDVASLVAKTLFNEKAKNEVFNCGTDRFVSYKGICNLVHSALKTDLDKDAKYLYFDPLNYQNVDFPFRRETFITSSGKAKRLLDWKPSHSLDKDIEVEVEDYIKSSAAKETWGLDQLRADMEILASKDIDFMFTYPFFDDASINPEKRPYPFESAKAK